MTKRKFILLSILKTWLIATVLSVIVFIIYQELTKVPQDFVRSCDMSGLAYGIIIFWILALSVTSFTSLLSLSKSCQNTIKIWLSWFLLPALFSIYFFISIFEGKIDKEGSAFFVIANLPWFLMWGLFYHRFKKLTFNAENNFYPDENEK